MHSGTVFCYFTTKPCCSRTALTYIISYTLSNMMIALVLIAAALCSIDDLVCQKSTCHPYDSTSKVCKHIGIYEETKYYINITDSIQTCPDKLTYCSLNGGSQEMICKQLAANDQSCKYDGDCLSVHCVK